MASNVSAHVIDDKDEEGFDWEAAIKQIDEVFEKSKSSSSCNPGNSSTHFSTPVVWESVDSLCVNGKKKPSAIPKQSTLDRFIKNSDARVSNSDHYEERECVDVEGEESAPFVCIDTEAAKSWIYPVNIPRRDYQFAITKTALFSNTLVALPTGLGKTLIAAVVMYNYFRWFPDGKIVFSAPSRPLVLQQIEACHNIVGIPQEWTIDMTGQLSPAKRTAFWKNKRVFFVTPQVLEKDIQSGKCLVKHLVCLVIDEAHRAMGNYSYCVAIRELLAVPVQMRILALTATPGSKQQTVQQVIDNLCISTLEYRNESDPDVSPYVHNRELELIQVALGKDAQEIHNLMLEVIRPYVAKLSANGILQNRDYQTLSPIDLLNSRDKFRQAPPPDLPHIKYGEVEAYFGALITLYHICKLLSSHGIRPAYEMLEEKLHHGNFARLMSKNESIMKAKLLMQHNLSHGAPSPKLSKMLEVLVDHFKTHDAQNSRVIIFSNFRGSVRDIMDSLGSIRDLVKATEFIGQSSGKALKGQSQKVQQAVLQKFRAGGYNVIVATSIGEEGLDIMEVDLVICFDANVSPLRMIQRMGRTGRKHDGRVVVLACEGSELRGYMRKQANTRAIKKHMRDGGMNSFNFYSSPRMVPHIFKPEVQFVELSIEKYVPRGRKLRDERTSQTPVIEEELKSAEINLIAKYFNQGKENVWRPSLIAFPDCQTYPSKVHEVMHSWRTRMLIDSMHSLQGITCLEDSNLPRLQDEVLFTDCSPARDEDHGQEMRILGGSPVAWRQEDGTDYGDPTTEALMPRNEETSPTFISKPRNVISISVPSFCFEQTEEAETMQTKCLASSKMNCRLDGTLPVTREFESCLQKEKLYDIPENMTQECIILKDKESRCEILNREEINFPSPVAEENNPEESELSPRLTSMIEIGVVPESPIDTGLLDTNKMCDFFPSDLALAEKLKVNLLSRYSIPAESNLGTLQSGDSERIGAVCCINDSGSKVKEGCVSYSSIVPAIVEDPQTPLENLTDNSSSKNWCLSSGEKLESVKPPRKFKRLRKLGDCTKRLSEKTITGPSSFSSRTKKFKKDVKTFIDEEAEVSTEGEISADEVNEDNDSYDGSFIDDRINPSAASTQAESGGFDMMAVYRRSLLSQSPAVDRRLASSPDSVASVSRETESWSPAVKPSSCLRTPQSRCIDRAGSNKNPEFLQKRQETLYSNVLPVKNIKSKDNVERVPFCTGSGSMRAVYSANKFVQQLDASMERRPNFSEPGSVPAINLDDKFLQESDSRIEESPFTGPHQARQQMLVNDDELNDDDLFYASLDLDAIEAQATLLLKQQSESVVQEKQETSAPQNMTELIGSPSFDLGIW